jgi:hypothetical protein
MRCTFVNFIKVSTVGWLLYSLLAAFYVTPNHLGGGDNHIVLDGDADANLKFNINSNSNSLNGITSTNTATDPTVVAYAVSLIKCGDKQSSAAGLVDASLILRHSIHKISSRHPSSGSKYDYKMYAIVHKQAEQCSAKLKDVGFEVIVVDSPIKDTEIRGEYLKKNIHKEWCCGSDEFIKMHAYTLPNEVIVHVDIDYAFYKPMDHLFDAILYDKDSAEGQKARNMLELERPGERLPDKIGAFITRDWGQVAPGKFPPAYQAGFLVARHDPKVMPEMVEIVKEGNYTDGWGLGKGWSGTGHGGTLPHEHILSAILFCECTIHTRTPFQKDDSLSNLEEFACTRASHDIRNPSNGISFSHKTPLFW